MIRLYDTKTRSKQNLETLERGKVGMYVCGPTVYNRIHIGNARTFISFDVIRRYLMWRGFDVTFVQNVTDVDDTPGTDRCGTVQLGKGAAIKLMDHSVICHSEVVKELDLTALERGIAVQRDILRAGGTDAGAIHVSRTGVKTGGVSVPCRYIHTPVEMVDLSDVQACVELVSAFVQKKLS